MPEIKLQHIVSCSGAETNHPADNLLKPEGTYKWRAPPDKNATVVIQLEKASKIHSIDIGNDGSAFVEVLVGRSTATSDQDFQVLLVASSFMTPLESRNGTNKTSVRMFGPDKLSKTAASEKWDRVKVVCRQPFSKSSSHGLSFIKFHSPPEEGSNAAGETGVKKLGAFKLKPDTEDSLSAGTAFTKKKIEKTDTPPLTGAAAMRAASRLAEESKPSTSKASPASTVKPEKPSPVGTKRKHDDSDGEEDTVTLPKPMLQKQSTSLSSVASKDEVKPKIKRTKSEPPKDSEEKSYHKLMEKVIFVLSGFQNPFRAELRDMATEMGAIYKPDWKKGCTHLICAFQNTPKYNQVKGKGKIVKKEWIQHCAKQRKLLPWRKYRLGDADTPPNTDSSESDEEEYVPKKTPKKVLSKKEPSPGPSPKKETPVKAKPQEAAKAYDSDTDVEDSGGDTEDELRRVKAKIAKGDGNDSDMYNNSTDEDEPKKKASPTKTPIQTTKNGDDSGLPELPDFFTKKHFFFYGDFSKAEMRELTRYIIAYDGEIEDYMSDKVNFVVTASVWDDNFDEALADHPHLVFVKPKWIHSCHDKDKLVPYQHFLIVPPDN